METPEFSTDFLYIVNTFPDAILYKNTSVQNPLAVLWIHTFYFEKRVTVMLPKMYLSSFVESMHRFNEPLTLKLDETHFDVKFDDLETMEYLKTTESSITLFLYADFIFYKLELCNKRRLATFLKHIKGTVYTKNYSNLERFGLKSDPTTFYGFSNISIFEYSNDYLEDFIELICENNEQTVYLSIHASTQQLLEIENAIEERGFKHFRKEPSKLVSGSITIQSSKTLKNNFLKHQYDKYYIITPQCTSEYDFLYYIKDIPRNAEVFFVEEQISIVEQYLQTLGQTIKPITRTVKESQEYALFEECTENLDDYSIISESFYKFKCPESFKKFDLSCMNKKQYDAVRDFIKIKFLADLGITIKTCQLAAPCSPKDRSKKLNSLANKISSNDYRCDCTIELFKDLTIGVVVWNSMFADRKTFEAVSGTYIYQTTRGTWKKTIVVIN